MLLIQTSIAKDGSYCLNKCFDLLENELKAKEKNRHIIVKRRKVI